ncbi:MAG: type II toxin-antitoxin system VapC family toxin [Proteobacteria bacterium]|nr:type II toxin-antitoxin system VapC family toxin [Pseudomonadota bacterium]
MRAYIDTSALVAAHTREPHTDLVQAWLTTRADNQLILSSWTLLECESALAIKVRRGEIDATTQNLVIAEIDAVAARLKPLRAAGEERLFGWNVGRLAQNLDHGTHKLTNGSRGYEGAHICDPNHATRSIQRY